MGHWGVKSYENDDANDAIDQAFESVHGAVYDDLMDDRNPMTFDQVQQKLANVETLVKSIQNLEAEVAEPDKSLWDDYPRLAYAGIVVRHAELGVTPPDDLRAQALDFLQNEAIDWEDATARKLRRQKEIRILGGE